MQTQELDCTNCKQGKLKQAYLESQLPVLRCTYCEGSFLAFADYLRWRQTQEASEIEEPNVVLSINAEETHKAILCPLSGGLMTKYRISEDSDQRIDFSPASSAVWMNKGEWLLIKSAGLALKLTQIVSHHWQHEIRQEEASEILQQMYEQRFGEDYARIKEIRQYLEKLPNRSEALAYLLAEDPYQPS